MKKEGQCVKIETTFASSEDAVKMAKLLIDSKFIACANISEITSIYEWKQKLEKTAEWLLGIKTCDTLVQKCVEMIKQNHPYELPMITWRVLDTTQDYANWVNESILMCKKGGKNT